MLVHYIDDNKMDINIFETRAKNHNGINISTSPCLLKGQNVELPSNIDCVLIDINRPDALSIEQDVQLVRNHRNVPIIFVTGGIADDYRNRAKQAGAIGVVEKQSLSVELVEQLLYNAVEEIRDDNTNTAFPLQPASNVETTTRRRDGSLILSYLDAASQSDLSDKYQQDIRNCITALRILSGHDCKEKSMLPLSTRVRGLQDDLSSLANHRQVALSLGIGKSAFSDMGSEVRVELGLSCFIGGLIRTMRPGGALSSSLYSDDQSPRMLFSSTSELLHNLDFLFLKRSPIYSKNFGAYFSMCTGLLLLGISQENVKLISKGSLQRITVH